MAEHHDLAAERERRRRIEDQYRPLGTRSPRCESTDCDESDPFALVGREHHIICYEHLAQESGRSMTELHHLLGRANDPLRMPVLGNDHRVLSDLQLDWPRDTLKNPDGSPLLRAAAAIRSWLDALWLILTRAIGWIPPALEWLDELLTDRIGERWWAELGWVAGP